MLACCMLWSISTAGNTTGILEMVQPGMVQQRPQPAAHHACLSLHHGLQSGLAVVEADTPHAVLVQAQEASTRCTISAQQHWDTGRKTDTSNIMLCYCRSQFERNMHSGGATAERCPTSVVCCWCRPGGQAGQTRSLCGQRFWHARGAAQSACAAESLPTQGHLCSLCGGRPAAL